MTQISENCVKTIMLVDTEITSARIKYTSSWIKGNNIVKYLKCHLQYYR